MVIHIKDNDEIKLRNKKKAKQILHHLNNLYRRFKKANSKPNVDTCKIKTTNNVITFKLFSS